MTYDEALEVLRALVRDLSGVSDPLVLLAYEDAGRPSSSHMTIQLVTDTQIGWSRRSALDELTQDRQARIQVDAYGATAVSGLRKTAALLQSSDARVLTASAAGMAIQGVGPVRNTTAIWMTKYERRATLEILMGYTVTYSAEEPETATSVGLVVHGTTLGSARYDRAPGYDLGTYSKTLTAEIPDAAPPP